MHTLDGKTYDGAVTIDAHGELLVTPKVGGPVHVEIADLLDASLVDKPADVILHRGVVLRDGTTLQADENLRKVDDSKVVFALAGKEMNIPLDKIARLIFRPVPTRLWARVPAGHYGALLDTGDFFEGDFKAIHGGKVRIESILFGISDFDPATQVLAVCLADVQQASSKWVIRLVDGSSLPADSIKFDAGLFMLGTSRGEMAVDPRTLVQISCGQGQLQMLADIKPGKIEPQDQGGYTVDATPMGASTSLQGCAATRSICIGGGVSVTFALDGSYRSFVARVGVPSEMPPYAHVRFIVQADGKEVYRSPDRTSVDDALVIGVNLNGIKSLTLHVACARAADLGGIGVWADPALIRQGQ